MPEVEFSRIVPLVNVKKSFESELTKTVFLLNKEGEIVSMKLIDAVHAINARGWKSEELGGTKQQIESRLRVFPKGQFGGYVRIGGKEVLIGVLHTLRVQSRNVNDFLHKFNTYDTVTGNGKFTNHLGIGNTLACVSIVRDPLFRKYYKEAEGYRDCMMPHRLIGHAHEFAEKNRIKFVLPYSRTLESAMRFHSRKSKFKPAAKLVGTLPEGRPADRAAKGGNAVFQYHTSQTSFPLRVKRWINYFKQRR